MGKRDLIVMVNSNSDIPESITDNNEVRAEIEVVSDFHGLGDENDKQAAPEIIFYVGIVLIILLSGIIIFSLLFLIRKRKRLEGYDEDGEYRPDIYRGRLERKEIGIELDEWGELYSVQTEESDTGAEGYFIGTGEGLSPPLIRKTDIEVRGPDRAPPPGVKETTDSPVLPVLTDAVTSFPVTGEEIKSLPPAGTDTVIDDQSSETKIIITRPLMVPVLKTMESSDEGPGKVKRVTTKPVGPKSAILPKAKTIPVKETTTELVVIRSKPLFEPQKSLPSVSTTDVGTETGSESERTPTASVILTKPITESDAVMTLPVSTSQPVDVIKLEKPTTPERQNNTGSGANTIPVAIVTKPVPDNFNKKNGPVDSLQSVKGSNTSEETAKVPEKPSKSTESEDMNTSPSTKIHDNSQQVTDTGLATGEKDSSDGEEIEDDIDDLLRDVEGLEM